jgi:hypothetical protein
VIGSWGAIVRAAPPKVSHGGNVAWARFRWAHELGQDVVWAIEDCRHVSQCFERSLVSTGERVLRVPPKLMGASRAAANASLESPTRSTREQSRVRAARRNRAVPRSLPQRAGRRDPTVVRSPRDSCRRADEADQPAALEPRGPRPRTRGQDPLAQARLPWPTPAHHPLPPSDAANCSGSYRPRAGQAHRRADP